MKAFIIAILLFSHTKLVAEEYRYNVMVTTGLQARIFDKSGKETTIAFSKNSNPKALFILTKVLELGINGTKEDFKWNGVPYMQTIILTGDLDTNVKRTGSAPNLAEAEDYQEFTLKDVKIKFPLVRHRPGKLFDTAYLETHFSFDTLMPDGLIYEGKKVDLDKHTIK